MSGFDDCAYYRTTSALLLLMLVEGIEGAYCIGGCTVLYSARYL